jgi:hypothetical protein
VTLGSVAEHAQGRPDLDRWLSEPAVRTAHRRESSAAAEAVWRAAATVRLRDARLLGRLVALRISGTEPDMTFASMFRSPPFVLLEDGPAFALSGLCGRIWTVRGELGRRAARYMRAFEPFIAAFQGLVGREALALAVRRAEL